MFQNCLNDEKPKIAIHRDKNRMPQTTIYSKTRLPRMCLATRIYNYRSIRLIHCAHIQAAGAHKTASIGSRKRV